MRAFLFCTLLQCFVQLAACQVTRQPLNFLQSGINTYTPQYTNAFSFTTNQAALIHSTSFTAGLYSERRFMLEELSWYQAVVVVPTKSGLFGWKSTYFGNAYNKATEIGLAYGRKLSDKLAIGAQFNYYAQQVQQHTALNAISVEGGILLKINEQLQTGFHIYNPNRSKLGKDQEKLPAIYTIGMGYEPSAQVAITAELQQTENEKLNSKLGLLYKLDKKLYAKAGLTTVNTLYNIGVGVRLKLISLEVLTSYHQQLGLTPGLVILFHTKEKQQ
jgi:hypothetical protein